MYSASELDLWKDRESILKQEQYLLEKYFTNKECKVMEAGTGGGRISLFLYNLGFKTSQDFIGGEEEGMLYIICKK